MNPPVVAFFNNKGGVGKTSLVYHLAWMYADLGLRVAVADFDPQANVTAAFLDEDQLERLWVSGSVRDTVYGAITPVILGTGATRPVPPVVIDERIGLIPGDLELSAFEAELSGAWPDSLDESHRAFLVLGAFRAILDSVVQEHRADLVLVDVGPNLGAINRSVLISCDHLVIPLAPDLFSLQGLRNLGPTLRKWRKDWQARLERKPDLAFAVPEGRMEPLGYVVFQHKERVGRPTRAYGRWAARIPEMYAREVLEVSGRSTENVDEDPHCLARLKHYASLMPMAQEAGKPVFALKPADGAFGGHAKAVRDSYQDFKRLATEIWHRVPKERGD